MTDSDDIGPVYVFRSRPTKPAFQVLLNAPPRRRPRQTWGDLWRHVYLHYGSVITCKSRAIGSALHLTSLPNMDDTVSQGRVLCREFLYSRLRRQGLLSLKVELQGAARRQTDVGLELLTLAVELERLHPTLYRNVCKQLNVVLSSETIVTNLYSGIADAMFSKANGVITWGRVVALFTVTSSLAAECIQQGHPEFVKLLVDGFSRATRNHLAAWIIKQGGWTALGRAFRGSRETPALWALTGAGAVLGFIVTMATTMYT